MRHTEGVTAPDTAWQKVALDIAERIRSGETPVGSKIASYSQLMERHNTSQGPVKKAIDYLRGKDILRGAQGAGVFVIREPAEDLAFDGTEGLPERVARVEQAVKEVAADGTDLRKTVGELQAHLLALYDRLGQPRPGTNPQPRQNRTDRRAANG